MKNQKMLGAVILLIGFVGTQAYPTSCKGVTEEQIVLLPTPGNCSTYIECALEEPVVMPCPNDLHWNDAAKRCDFPEIANCKQENLIRKRKAYPTSCKGVTEEQTVLLPNPGNCSTYIECFFEEPVVMPCPEGLHWNDAIKQCDFPHIAKCQNTRVIRQYTSCEGVPSYIDVLLPNSANCGSYIQCVHGKPVVRPCPEGLHWSAAANRCEWPDIANCKTNTCEGVPETVDVLLPNPDDCGSYIQCVHQKPVVRPCPPGLHWSVAANRCEWPNVAQCGIASRKTWTSCKGVPETETVLLPNPKNCSTYIECTDEQPIVMPCPEGLHWNDVNKQCDYPNIAKCKETQSLKPKTWTSCEGVPENETVLLPTPGNCSTYIECAYEKPVIMSCPEGLHWNNAAKQCDFPEIANCQEVKKSVQKLANSCEGVPSYVDVLLPNPADCGSYIQCVHGKPLVRPCPGGLHWSVAANRCEWPDIANCKINSCDGVPETVDVLLPNPGDCGSYIQCVHQKPVVRPCPSGLHWSIAANRCEWPNIAQCASINP